MGTWYQKLTWFILHRTYGPSLKKKFNVEYRELDGFSHPKPPFMLYANHAHISDPFIVGNFSRNVVRYMANIENVTFMKKFGSEFVGTFNKKKGESDLAAVKKTFSLLKKGHTVGIFPEGDRSWDGETQPINENVALLSKKSKTPLMLAKTRGGYISYPRWAKYPRIGKMIVEFRSFESDEISNLPKDEFTALLRKHLYQDDLNDEEIMSERFTCEASAEGIEFLIWYCPKCKAHDTMKSKGDIFECTKCGAKWETDANARIVEGEGFGKNVKEASEFQKSKIKEITDSASLGEMLTHTPSVDLYNIEKSEPEHLGKGNLALYKDRIVFAPSGEKKELQFHINSIKYLIDNFNRNTVFSYEKTRYKLFLNGSNAWKWIFFVEHLKNIQNENTK